MLFLLHRVGAILPTDSHMFLMRADPGTVIILILHLKSITSRANSSGGNPVNPQPRSFVLNSPSTAGLKPRISVQRVTLASELKHSQQFVQALGRWPTQEHPQCSGGFQGAEYCSHRIGSSTAAPRPNPPAHRHLCSAPSAARSQGQQYQEQQTGLSTPSDKQWKLWHFLDKLHQKISSCWEETL